jgi:hypothetical protein
MAKQQLTVLGYDAFNKLRMRLNREGTAHSVKRIGEIYTLEVI